MQDPIIDRVITTGIMNKATNETILIIIVAEISGTTIMVNSKAKMVEVATIVEEEVVSAVAATTEANQIIIVVDGVKFQSHLRLKKHCSHHFFIKIIIIIKQSNLNKLLSDLNTKFESIFQTCISDVLSSFGI